MSQDEETRDALAQLVKLFNSGSVLYESNGEPTGMAGVGDVGIAAFALSMELAASTGDPKELIDAIIRHKQHAPEIFESVLYGAVLNLLVLQLEPAFRLLDGTSTDRRARAVKDWEAVKQARGL